MRLRVMLLNTPKCVEYLMSYRRRYIFSTSDLRKAYNKAKPISDKQKSEIKRFWRPYLNTLKARHAFDIRWFDVYNRTNIFGADLVNYIPDGFYYAMVDQSLTGWRDANTFDDKNLYDLYFSDVNQPATIVRKVRGVYMDTGYGIISESDAVDKCMKNKSVIIKPSVNACAGKGIVICSGREHPAEIIFRRPENPSSAGGYCSERRSHPQDLSSFRKEKREHPEDEIGIFVSEIIPIPLLFFFRIQGIIKRKEKRTEKEK